MFQVHNVANEADFARGTLEGSYQCSKCFQYSERQWCGALRASEWDRETGIMTIWHQGKHICLMKKPPIEKDDAAKMITMLKHIMRLNPYATKTQIMDLGSHYHLSRGDHRLSQLFIRICMKNKSIYEQALKEVRLQNLLDILREVKNDPQYMWKPRMIMADENGANKKVVGNVLGEEMRQRTISCQWHFLRCVKKVVDRINKEDRDEFLKLANALVHKAVTKNAYEEYSTKLETICIRANCKSWCDFWHRRRFHFVSAFRGFFLPGVNLAEAGQAGMKRQQNHQLLSLVDAAYKDISAWLWQDELYKAMLDNCTTQKGWVRNMAQKTS